MDLGFIRAAPGRPMEARFPCQQGNLQAEGPALAEARSWWSVVPVLGGQRRQPSLAMGTWFCILWPGVTCQRRAYLVPPATSELSVI